MQAGPSVEPPPPPPPIEDAPLSPAKPAWRTVVKHERREKQSRKQAAQAPPPPAIAAAPAPQPQLPAWAQWKRVFYALVGFTVDVRF